MPVSNQRKEQKIKSREEAVKEKVKTDNDVESDQKQVKQSMCSVKSTIIKLFSLIFALASSLCLCYVTFVLLTGESVSILSLSEMSSTSAVEFCSANQLEVPLPQSTKENEKLRRTLEQYFYQTGAQYFWLRAGTNANSEVIDTSTQTVLDTSWISWANGPGPNEVIAIDSSGTWHYLPNSVESLIVCVTRANEPFFQFLL